MEEGAKEHPDESKLNQMRANLTTEAADVVRTVRTEEKLEGKGEIGSSLAWYLKARKLYPSQMELIQQRFQFVKQSMETESLRARLQYVLE